MFRPFIFILTITTLPGVAQPGLNLGIRTGLSLVNQSLHAPEKIDYNLEVRPDFHIAVVSQIGLSDKLFFSPEYQVSRKGCHKSSYGIDSTRPSNLFLTYLTLPLLLEYKPTSKFSLKAGPEIGLLLKATSKERTGDVDLIEYWGDGINRFEISAAIGLEYVLNDKWIIGPRYVQGFTSLFFQEINLIGANGQYLGVENPLFLNRALQISATYQVD